jgi:putative spermidine/putrescine transport system ATP-binding protein
VSSVELRQITKSYGAVEAVRKLDVTIEDGEFFTILGASGSGKTTCLRMVAGLISPTKGRILLGGADVTNTPPHQRNVGLVFQNYALFPHLSVERNIAFGLEARRVPGKDLKARVDEALELVQLEAYRNRLPRELSGGQKQRVALARAVVIRPDVLLLDEPLSALDLRLRQELRVGIKNVQRRLGLTTLLVTHDQGEALSLSDRIAVMSGGEMLQIDHPSRIYQRPRSRAVADFIGGVNLFECEVVSAPAGNVSYVVRLREGPSEPFEVAKGEMVFQPGDPCLFGIRPEDMSIEADARPGLPVKVVSVDYFGDGWSMECVARSGARVLVTLTPRLEVPRQEAGMVVGWASGSGFLLPLK